MPLLSTSPAFNAKLTVLRRERRVPLFRSAIPWQGEAYHIRVPANRKAELRCSAAQVAKTARSRISLSKKPTMCTQACSAADRTTVGVRVRFGKDREAGDQGCPAHARNLSSYSHAIPACVEEGRVQSQQGVLEPTYNSPAIRRVD